MPRFVEFSTKDGVFLNITDNENTRMRTALSRTLSAPPTVWRTSREQPLPLSSLGAAQTRYYASLEWRAQETVQECLEHMLHSASGCMLHGASGLVQRTSIDTDGDERTEGEGRDDSPQHEDSWPQSSLVPTAEAGLDETLQSQFHSSEESTADTAAANRALQGHHQLRTSSMYSPGLSSPGGPCECTLMIRNLPCRLTQEDLMVTIRGLGLDGTYNFLYVVTSHRKDINVGYAFVNLIDQAHEHDFVQVFNGLVFPGFESHKVCAVNRARLQGLEANLAQFLRGTGRARGQPFHLGRLATDVQITE